MQPTLASPTGNYGDPNLSPQVQEWIRRQLLEQAISAQSRGAINNSTVLQPTPGVIPAAAAAGSDAGMLPPPNQAQLAAPAAAAVAGPTPPMPMQGMQGAAPMPMQGMAGNPQMPAADPMAAMQPPPAANGGALGIEGPARGSTVDPNAAGWMAAPDHVKEMFSAGPAATPEAVEERRALWTQFVDGFKNSPNLPALLVHFGAQMTQPLAPGQTPVGQFAASAQGSLDYLQARKMQDAEIANKQAQTGHTQAQTTTETKKPALVEAETKVATANAGRNEAETETINASRKELVNKLRGEVDELVAKKTLTLEQARLYKTKADTNAAEVASEIELRKAHSYYFTHPEMHARAMESAKNQSIEALAKALVSGGDDELTLLYKTDPGKALAKARVEAQAGQVGQYWKDQQETREANDIYNQLSDQYEAEVKSGKVKGKEQTKEKYMLNQLITETLPGTVVAKIHARMGQAAKTNPPAKNSGGAAPGWGIQKVPTEGYGGGH